MISYKYRHGFHKNIKRETKKKRTFTKPLLLQFKIFRDKYYLFSTNTLCQDLKAPIKTYKNTSRNVYPFLCLKEQCAPLNNKRRQTRTLGTALCRPKRRHYAGWDGITPANVNGTTKGVKKKRPRNRAARTVGRRHSRPLTPCSLPAPTSGCSHWLRQTAPPQSHRGRSRSR